ncbi:MAG: SPOR domain-containing protein, partial [Rhodobacterales bacterium]|nr:SPOR domain-containing protein [Rhodobacterales bacterium]
TAVGTVQIGIFSVAANARRAADMLSRAGIPATVTPGATQGKPFWSVTAGSAASQADRAPLLEKIRALGFTDAYFLR